MFQGLTGWHALIVLAVILLLFGAAKLPALAKSVGQSAKIFKNEIKSGQEGDGVQASAEPMHKSSTPPADGRQAGTSPGSAENTSKP